jgi:KUP system potassium uptake protein
MKENNQKFSWNILPIIRAIGAVFGDIGTSPLYTLAIIITLTRPQPEDLLGVTSLIIWTMILLVTIQYGWLAMNLSLRGEGGTVVLGEIASKVTKNMRLRRIYKFLVFIGLSFLIGDGVITPAITILSSVEGLRLIPNFQGIAQAEIIFIAILITLGLFSLQSRGTGKIGEYFGPIMILWFTTIGAIGNYYVIQKPEVLHAFNPYHGLKFIINHPVRGLIVLSEVILAATGGEALYADMGHLGSYAIRRAWIFVFIALVLNYLGQTAYVLKYHLLSGKVSPFFSSAQLLLGKTLYIPFLLLVIISGIIASQAMISGVFSIIFQAINSRIFPMLYIKHTSTEISTQIYIPSVNWILMVGVIFMYFIFKESHHMAAAYGFAVNVVMIITAFFLMVIYFSKKRYFHSLISGFLFLVDIIFWISNFYKIPHGAYWSVIFASVPLSIIFLYYAGQLHLYKKLKFMPLEEFLVKFYTSYETCPKIEGTAIFLIRDVKKIPPYVFITMFKHGIIYENNLFLSLIKKEEPFGVEVMVKEDLAKGLKLVEIKYGYSEVLDVEKILKNIEIRERVIFYGVEHIKSEKLIWNLFAVMKKALPAFVEFYKFPPEKIHGVTVRVEF